jgi:opacity protein-like surface antigen
MSIIRVIGAGVVMVLAAAPSALAQVEVSGNIGYVSSDGVTSDGILAGDGNIYDEVNPVSGLGYHFTLGVMAGEQFEVGFLWGRQQSELEVGGTNTVTVGDMNVDNYHGYFQYNFGDSSSKVRPFVMGGLGATKYGNVDFTRLNGQTATIDSNTRFSTTWGGGVKAYASDHLGFRAAARWTPTYIKSDAAGWWCDPYWGCYLVSEAQYSNQFEFTGGIILRF